VPAHESRWGTFVMLRFKTERELRAILQDLLGLKRAAKGSPEQMIRDFYLSGMDMKRRNAAGLAPLEPLLKRVRAIATKKDLLDTIAYLHEAGVDVAWGAGIDHDDKDSEQYVLRVGQAGIGMPDRDYYLKDDVESKRVRAAYEAYVERLYRLMGRSVAEAKEETIALLAFETALAAASRKKEDLRDPHKNYNKMTIAKLGALAPAIAWPEYFRDIHAPRLSTLIVNQPEFMVAISKMVDETPLVAWKSYLELSIVDGFAGSLSTPFIRASFAFHGTALSGVKRIRPLWRRVLGVTNAYLGETLGQLYVAKHFPPDAKKRMLVIVDDLFTAYEARIKGLDWMSAATKKKALAKLKILNKKIGYPDKWKSYRGLEIRSDDYVGNIIRANIFEHRRELKKIGRPIRRWEWLMYPQTVNAYFYPNLNDIVFPAAILQPPFFNIVEDEALNYGCIGAVIGHEITHGFDDEGSKFDVKGNLENWWMTEDRARFDQRAEVVRKQFDRYVVADGVKVNGKLTLGENIADLGGLSIAYDAYQLELARRGRRNIDGFTPEQRFFIGFALFERENVRPEFEKTQVLTDPHSPGTFRINGPLSNFSAFYDAFGIKKGDKLYRPAADRTTVW
ncbi:M13 family metallopeptidase, partial [Patescibacteria group bacterium]|nr:M13 family metallopeptidase [Patescibacteria group bacterium]